LIFKENEQRNKAEFTISAPCVRDLQYSMTNLSPSKETGADLKQGDKVTIKYKGVYVQQPFLTKGFKQ
jgi:hypothetical protein